MLVCDQKRTLQLANTATGLQALNNELQEKLINWGYAVCDAAMPKYVSTASVRPKGFPYPIGV